MADPMVKVTGINHVVLHVADLDRSLAFYMGVLGFEDRNAGGGGGGGPARRASFLRCGMQGLDLFEAEEAHGGEEMNHMALNVEADELDEVVEALTAAGIEASERTRRNSVFIFDPDGHRIEMLPKSAHERTREREAAAASA
ncbi:MAG TPA: VOC family protein [Acidimicrobiales bacterium]|nr:VOC family protein [Acidimicrobiales bacterium]